MCYWMLPLVWMSIKYKHQFSGSRLSFYEENRSTYGSNIEDLVMISGCFLLFGFFVVNSTRQFHGILNDTCWRIGDNHILCLIETQCTIENENLEYTFIESVSVRWKSRTTGARDDGDDICSRTDGQTKPIDMGHVTFAWSVMSQTSVRSLK